MPARHACSSYVLSLHPRFNHWSRLLPSTSTKVASYIVSCDLQSESLDPSALWVAYRRTDQNFTHEHEAKPKRGQCHGHTPQIQKGPHTTDTKGATHHRYKRGHTPQIQKGPHTTDTKWATHHGYKRGHTPQIQKGPHTTDTKGATHHEYKRGHTPQIQKGPHTTDTKGATHHEYKRGHTPQIQKGPHTTNTKGATHHEYKRGHTPQIQKGPHTTDTKGAKAPNSGVWNKMQFVTLPIWCKILHLTLVHRKNTGKLEASTIYSPSMVPRWCGLAKALTSDVPSKNSRNPGSWVQYPSDPFHGEKMFDLCGM